MWLFPQMFVSTVLIPFNREVYYRGNAITVPLFTHHFHHVSKLYVPSVCFAFYPIHRIFSSNLFKNPWLISFFTPLHSLYHGIERGIVFKWDNIAVFKWNPFVPLCCIVKWKSTFLNVVSIPICICLSFRFRYSLHSPVHISTYDCTLKIQRYRTSCGLLSRSSTFLFMIWYGITFFHLQGK